MPSTSFPNPLGDGGTAGNPSSIAVLAQDVMPVRLVFNQPIPVKVINWPGKPPPLPSMLKPPSFVPPLPKPLPPPVNAKPEPLGSTAAAVALGGVIFSGLQQVKATFIDPLLGAAKSGFDAGLAKGVGAEALSKTFMLLGVTIGGAFLPSILKASSATVGFADWISREFDRSPDNFRTKMLVQGPNLAGGLARLLVGPSERAGGVGAFSRFVGMTKPEASRFDKVKQEVLPDIIQSIRQSIGGQGGFVGVADVREQAQMAAFQDPLEAQIKKYLLKYLEDAVAGNQQERAAEAFVKRLAENARNWQKNQ